MDPTIVVAIIGGIVSIIVGVINMLKNQKLNSENIKLKKENETQDKELSAVTVLYDHRFISTVEYAIDEIFSSTKATRFMLLFAVNGKSDFKKVSAILEKRKNHDKSAKTSKFYKRLKIDNAYKMMLNYIEHADNNKMSFITEKMNNNLLKRIYMMSTENVKSSNVYFIVRIKVNVNNDLLLFCSLSTTINEPFTPEEQFIMDSNISQIQESAKLLKTSL